MATINDPSLGEYKAPMRRIVLGDKSVEIVPRARKSITSIRPPGAEKPMRAQGVVSIRSLGWVSYDLFQLPVGKWYIRSTAQNLNPTQNAKDFDNPVEVLDAEQFEAAIASVLG
jgi:hypothetical protein